jgi:hypothetical protein
MARHRSGAAFIKPAEAAVAIQWQGKRAAKTPVALQVLVSHAIDGCGTARLIQCVQ